MYGSRDLGSRYIQRADDQNNPMHSAGPGIPSRSHQQQSSQQVPLFLDQSNMEFLRKQTANQQRRSRLSDENEALRHRDSIEASTTSSYRESEKAVNKSSKLDLMISKMDLAKHFSTTLKTSKQPQMPTEDDFMPPIDSFLELSTMRFQREKFFDDIRIGHVLCCSVTSITDSGLIVVILCNAFGYNREIEHLKLPAHCSSRDIPELLSGQFREVSDVYSVKDKVKGVVVSVNRNSEKIEISLHPRDLPRNMESKVELGLVRFDDLPESYKSLMDSDDMSYSQILHSNVLFRSPGSIQRLCSQLNLSTDANTSLLPNVIKQTIAEDLKAKSLRNQQSRIQALQCVVKGVKLYKDGSHTDALSLYNKALEYDPDNVEAFVARGALYANNESYPKALEDFQQAIKLNPKHQNATDYFVQTLHAYARDLEDIDNIEGAVKCYKQILDISADDTLAQQRLSELRKSAVVAGSPAGQEPTVSSTRPDSRSPAIKELRADKRPVRYSTEESPRKRSDTASSYQQWESIEHSADRQHRRRSSHEEPSSKRQVRNRSRSGSLSRSPSHKRNRNDSQERREHGDVAHPRVSDSDQIRSHDGTRTTIGSEPQADKSQLDIFSEPMAEENQEKKKAKPATQMSFLPYCLATDPTLLKRKVMNTQKPADKEENLPNIRIETSTKGRLVSSLEKQDNRMSESHGISISSSGKNLQTKGGSEIGCTSRSRSNSRSRSTSRRSWSHKREGSRSRESEGVSESRSHSTSRKSKRSRSPTSRSRPRSSRTRSRSRIRKRSRSRSRSRIRKRSKSRSRSRKRSRSRSRSIKRSRSRSRSGKRSRSRNRSGKRSRSRSINKSRVRKRSTSESRAIGRNIFRGSSTGSSDGPSPRPPGVPSENTLGNQALNKPTKQQKMSKSARRRLRKLDQKDAQNYPNLIPLISRSLDGGMKESVAEGSSQSTTSALSSTSTGLAAFKPMKIAETAMKQVNAQLERAREGSSTKSTASKPELKDPVKASLKQTSSQQQKPKPATEGTTKKLQEMEDFLKMLKQKKDTK